jgi:hypothetical protein
VENYCQNTILVLLQKNKHLFKLEILTHHRTRKAALSEELRIQLLNDVVNSTEYFNESLAKKNGFFGRILKGELHPNYGKKITGRKHSEETKKKISKAHQGMTYSNETKEKLSISAKKRWKEGRGNPPPKLKGGAEHPSFGKKTSNETKKKISEAKKGKNNNPKSLLIKKMNQNGEIISTYNGLYEAERKNNFTRGKLQYYFHTKGNSFIYQSFLWQVNRP